MVAALEAFPDDRRVRCEGVLTVQNLSLTAGGARAMTKAGVAPVIVKFLRGALIKEDERALAARADDTVDGDHLDRDGKTQATEPNREVGSFLGGLPPYFRSGLRV